MGYRKNKLEYEPILSTDEEMPIEYANLDNSLNRRQRNFIWQAVNNPRLSLVECAHKAGYKDARQSANKLMNHPKIRKEYNYLMNETKKKYELNYDRAVQDLYDIRDKALEAGSFNAAISAQNSLLKVGGLVVDRKEVMFGKIDQMSREEVEKRLAQLMGNVALTDGSGEADQRSSQEDEAISLERLEIEDQLTVDQKLEENSTVD
jgi:phage terminase small subunit